MENKKNILITGIAGLLGSNLAQENAYFISKI